MKYNNNVICIWKRILMKKYKRNINENVIIMCEILLLLLSILMCVW